MDHEDPYADEMPDQDDPSDDRGFAEPPMDQAEIDQAMFDEQRARYIESLAASGIPEWERASYEKLVELVNGPEIEALPLSHGLTPEQHRAASNAVSALCQDSNDNEHDALVEMLEAFAPRHMAIVRDIEAEDDDEMPERDIDWELKAEREDSF